MISKGEDAAMDVDIEELNKCLNTDVNKQMGGKNTKKKKKKKKSKKRKRSQPRRRPGPVISLQPESGNRCSFCGHLGHTIRTCDAHEDKCGCDDYKSFVHIDIQRGQPRCTTCRRYGHEATFCSVFVLV
jgi:hypothetical protein